MSLSAKINEKANLIWAIADKLTGVYKPHEYGEIILPLTVIRRFDCVLSDTKEEVLKVYEEKKDLQMKDVFLKKASNKEFYNTSKYNFEKLVADPDNIEANFRDYLKGFSENVSDIIENFKFDNHITTMANKGILYMVIKEFTTEKANLHPDEISNLEMGYIFEEITRRFSEAHNEDAGQHYTPREVIRLMVNILFCEDSNILTGERVAKTIYDPTCGTGGMLSVAEEYLHELNKQSELISFGQEINDQTYAICKSDMLIKGNNSDYIKNGNTLSNDMFSGQTFDYIIANPPFGREWKNEKRVIEEEAKKGFGGRFGAGLPAASDGQMLFLQTAISKMKDISKGGSRIAIVHNGSPLFTGDAGSGPSEIRKYIIENDLLECIVALPNDIFYNTGIATYIWVLSNKKGGTKREGKVQLINANGMFEKRRKSLGNKRNDIPETAITEITNMYGDFVENEFSKIFDNEDFGFTKITIERPLRQSFSLADSRLDNLKNGVLGDGRGEENGENYPTMSEILSNIFKNYDQEKIYYNKEEFEKVIDKILLENGYKDLKENDSKAYKSLLNMVVDLLAETDPDAPIVNKNKKKVVDTKLRDTENVPLKEDIEEYFEREVLPFAEDAWIDKDKSKVGYEIPFTRYFYKYETPKPSMEIMAEIMDIETELNGVLAEIFEI